MKREWPEARRPHRDRASGHGVERGARNRTRGRGAGAQLRRSATVRRLWRPRLPEVPKVPELGVAAGRALWTSVVLVSVAAGFAAREGATTQLEQWAPSWFRIARAEVLGGTSIASDDLRLWIGVRAGAPRASIAPEEVSNQLRSHPLVADARVSIALPGVLLVRIIDRSPVARVRVQESEWWVDATGMPFAPEGTRGVDPNGLPLLVTQSAVTLGSRSAALASAIGSLQQLRAAGLRVAEWHLESDPEGTPAPWVRLRGGVPPILLGGGDRGVQLHGLTRALAVSPVRDAEAIDLRFRDQVIFWPEAPFVGASSKRALPDG